MPISKTAFTMIELIFTILIISILSSIAIPKLMLTRDDAKVAKSIEYVVGVMSEILTYTIAKGETENDLRKMSPLLIRLQDLDRATFNIPNRSTMLKIGEQDDCITVSIVTTPTSDIAATSFVDTEDRICRIVQASIKEKDYPIVLRGRLINY